MPIVESIVECGNLLGEGVVWHPRELKLYWVDIKRARIHWCDPVGADAGFVDTEFKTIGSIALRRKGGLLLATERGMFVRDGNTGACAPFAPVDLDKDGLRMNDGRCDRAGRFWVGSMRDPDPKPVAALYRVDPDGRVITMESALAIPNSTAFSPDDRTFYFADTRKNTIWAYDFDLAAGAISNKRVLISYDGQPGHPDGSCVDADGCLWNAAYGGSRIVRITPAGKIDRTIDLPATYATCCCFGGPDLDTLYITTSNFPLTPEERAAKPLNGALLAVRPGVKGLPEAEFAG